MYLVIIYLIYMYKQDLASNKLYFLSTYSSKTILNQAVPYTPMLHNVTELIHLFILHLCVK